MSREKKSSGFAVFIILLGIAIILVNLNILEWRMFWGIVHLWPLLLVVLGLSILFKHVHHLNLVVWLIFIGIVIGYSYLNMDSKSWFIGEPVSTSEYEYEMKETTGSLDLDVSVGSIHIDTYEEGIRYSIPDQGIRRNEVSGEEPLTLIVKDNTRNEFFTAFQNRYYNFELPGETTWEMRIDGAVISGEIDVEELVIDQLNVDYAVGDLTLVTSEEGYYKVDFALGNVTIDVPNDVQVKVYVNGAINSLDYPSGYTKEGDYLYSQNFDDTLPYVDIYIDLAIGNVEIK